MTETESVHYLAEELYTFLSSRFPVCCSSDEFVYFPQAVSKRRDWSQWDDLSPDSVEDTVAGLNSFLNRLSSIHPSRSRDRVPCHGAASLLSGTIRNLEEQFTLVRTHATQPTFALTVATAGIVQALQHGTDRALSECLASLPGFLERAALSLDNVPVLYRDQGMEMAKEIKRWVKTQAFSEKAWAAMEALDAYTGRLSRVPAVEEFRLDRDLFERVVACHTHSGLSMEEALSELEEEKASTLRQLRREAEKLGHGRDWETANSSLKGVRVPPGGRIELLRGEIERLKQHCRRLGFLVPGASSSSELLVEHLPGSLKAVRAADSYSARPGYPFQGGVFYIFGGGSLGEDSPELHPVYRMTAAHETYPGHHLLDACRWNSSRPLLRPLEHPLFYEGWACFGEDLMLLTGAFDLPGDRLVLLRRRLRHAVRGKADLELHSGRATLARAAGQLTAAGFRRERAWATVRKYALRPAYQMCYTIGRRRFQSLFDEYGQGQVKEFVNSILTHGELLFEDLGKVLEGTVGRGENEKVNPRDSKKIRDP